MVGEHILTQRKGVYIAWALGALIVVVAFSFALFAGTSEADAVPAVEQPNGLGAYLARSPGERGDTFLVSQKLIRQRVAGVYEEPVQRALGKIFDTPPEIAIAGLTPAAQLDPITPGFLVPLRDIGSAADVPTGDSSLPVVGTPIADNDAGPPGGIVPVPVAPVPSSPGSVPEPETWLMLLLGMAMSGAALRRDRAIRACNQRPAIAHDQD